MGLLTLEEQKFKQKCNELKKRISEIEESNEIATIALSRTRVAIRRLRLENSVLLEKLEQRLMSLPQTPESFEDMSRPTSPILTDELMNLKAVKNGNGKNKKLKATLTSSSSVKKMARDPNLPKKPLNAYWIFFEKEKERVKAELEAGKSEKPALDVSKTLTERWKSMSDEQKSPYQKLYEEDRLRYQTEMTIFNQNKDGENSTTISQQNNREPDASEEDENTSVMREPLESEHVKRQKLDSSPAVDDAGSLKEDEDQAIASIQQ